MYDGSLVLQAIETMRSIADAMAAVSLHWEPQDGRSPQPVKNEAGIIEERYSELSTLVNDLRACIVEDWNEIISNDARQMELSDLAETYKAFRRKAEEFDDGFRRNADSAYGLFCNEWIAREYLVLCADTERRNRSIFSALSGRFNRKPAAHRPFRGIARTFKDYFAGVDDNDIMMLVKYNKHLEKRPKWLKSRTEAVLFADHFGLDAKDMNHSFVIPGRDGLHRDLNKTGDAPAYIKEEYPIYPLLQKYKDWNKM